MLKFIILKLNNQNLWLIRCWLYLFFLCCGYAFSVEGYSDNQITNFLSSTTLTNMVIIQLRPEVEVSLPKVYLSDIGQCVGIKSLCQDVLGIEIAQSLQPSYHTILKIEEIEKRIKQEFSDIDFIIQGAQQVNIFSAYIELNKDILHEYIQNELDERCEISNTLQITLADINLPIKYKIWPGNFTIKILNMDNIYDLNNIIKQAVYGQVKLHLTYVPENKLIQEFNFSVYANLVIKKLLPIASVNIDKGTILSKDLFVHDWVRITNNKKIIESLDNIENYITTQIIPKGLPIFIDYIYKPKLIEHRQIIKMILQNGDLQIITKARALNAGYLGDIIKIQPLNMSNELSAKVIGLNTVEVIQK